MHGVQLAHAGVAVLPAAAVGLVCPHTLMQMLHDAHHNNRVPWRDAGVAVLFLQAGVTTDAIDKAVHQMIIDNGAYPSPLTYGNFPKSVCTSVNECICHGIPDSRALVDGDIINIDVTVYLDVSTSQHPYGTLCRNHHAAPVCTCTLLHVHLFGRWRCTTKCHADWTGVYLSGMHSALRPVGVLAQ